MTEKAFQDYYPDDLAHCYGCGKNNEHGHQIKTCWDGEESVTRYLPDEKYTAVPGFVYGGLLASLVDCHSTGTAAAAFYKKEGRDMDTEPVRRCVTASLKVDYLAPTPQGVELELRGKVTEISEKKAVIESTVSANGKLVAKGYVVAVLVPENMFSK